MSSLSIKELVSDNKKVLFVRYAQGELWYKCENGFEFPVPISDTGSGVFLPEDKALLFMRWIRAHIKYIDEARSNSDLSLSVKSVGFRIRNVPASFGTLEKPLWPAVGKRTKCLGS